MKCRSGWITGSIIIVVLTGCTDMGSEPEADEITFSNHIQTILNHNCTTNNPPCHEGVNASDGLNLSEGESYTNLVNVASSYAGLLLVQPGNADSSVLYLKVTDDSQTGERMPPLGWSELTNGQITEIRIWIDEGAENN